MKDTGVTSHVDRLGRICIPIPIRRRLGLDENAIVEYHVNDNNELIIRKHKSNNDVQDSFDALRTALQNSEKFADDNDIKILLDQLENTIIVAEAVHNKKEA